MKKSKWLRRGLALVLIMALVAIPLLSLGGEGSKGQIGQYVDVDENGEILANTNNNNYTTNVKNPTNEAITIDMTKKINATDKENVFQITLGVETNEVREEITEPSRILLVFDVSTSMDFSLTEKKHIDNINTITRWMTYKKSMEKFINSFLSEDGENYFNGNQIAIVAFGGDNYGGRYQNTGAEKVLCDWTSDKDEAVNSFINYDYVSNKTIKAINSRLTIEKKTDKLITKKSLREEKFGDNDNKLGNTNIEAGLNKASSVIDSLNKKPSSLILVTDGAATRSYSFKTTSDEDQTRAEAAKYAIEAANNLRNAHKNVKMYGFSIGSDAASSSIMTSKPDGVLDSVYTTETENSMNVAFEAIAEKIVHRVKVWNVIDPMSKWVKFIDFEDAKSAKFTNNQIEWELGADAEKINDDKYAYSLSYFVELDTKVEGYKQGTYYPTNQQTFLEYTFSSDENLVEDDANKDTAFFRIPTVAGPGEVAGETATQEQQGSVKGEEGFADDEDNSAVLGEEAKTSDSMSIIIPLIVIALIAALGLVVVSIRQRKQD